MSMLAMFDAFTCIDDYVHSRKDPLRAREGSELRKHATTSGRGARTGSERLPIMQKTKTHSWRNTALDTIGSTIGAKTTAKDWQDMQVKTRPRNKSD